MTAFVYKKSIMKTFIVLLLTLGSLNLFGQDYLTYEPSNKYPFGRLNPEAPKQTADFAPLIGTCTCRSVMRVDQNTWADTLTMVWTFKYIMNGMAVQDETFKEDGTYAGSIRQFNADSAKWYVHYYSFPSVVSTLPSWSGNKMTNGDILLYREQKAPNGLEGYYRITFSNISQGGYDWIGEWVNLDETIVYPTWKIFCSKNGG